MRLQKSSIHHLINLRLDQTAFRAAQKYINCIEQLSTTHQKIIFLKRCKNNKIFPKFIDNIRLPNENRYRLFSTRIKNIILNKEIRFHYHNIEIIKMDIEISKRMLMHVVGSQQFSQIVNIGNDTYQSCKMTKKEMLKKKFCILSKNSNNIINMLNRGQAQSLEHSNHQQQENNQQHENNHIKNRITVIQGTIEPSNLEASILELGPKFKLSCRMNDAVARNIKISLLELTYQIRWRSRRKPSVNTSSQDLIAYCPFENHRSVPPHANNLNEWKMKKMMIEFESLIEQELKSFKPKSNLSKIQHQILQNMQKDAKIYIPSDKGGEFTIINKNDYIRLGIEHLSDTSTYKMLCRDNTEELRKALNKIWKRICITNTLPIKLKDRLITPKCHVQKFYHVIKTHKKDIAIRPIVSNCGGPFERMSWLIQKILTPLLFNVKAHLFNTYELIDELKRHDIINKDNYLLFPVSFDVISLYTNVPIDEAIQTALEYVRKYKPIVYGLKLNDIEEILCFVLKNNTFCFNNTIYQQIRGLAMGSRVAPILAILVLDKFENTFVYNNISHRPTLYLRYVDDIFAMFYNSEDADNYLIYLNNLHPSIKFELCKPDKDGFLPMLDIKISHDGTQTHYKYYEKLAKRGIFIHAKSAQPMNMKLNAIIAEIARIRALSSNTNSEIISLTEKRKCLKENGYTKSIDHVFTTPKIKKFDLQSYKNNDKIYTSTSSSVNLPIRNAKK